MKLVLLTFLVLNARASTVIDGNIATTATQALVRVIAPTASACAIQVSESSSLTPLHDDFNPAIFTGADLEANHIATSWISGSNTVRVLRLFARTSDLALDGLWHSRAGAANQQYYGSITCDATVNFSFSLKAPQGTSPEGPPIKVGAFGNLAFPEFTDFSKPVIEPHSGIKIYTTDPNNWGISQIVNLVSNWYLGGIGWTNLSNITNFSTPGTTVGNTNPLTLLLSTITYNDQLPAIGGNWYADNFTDLAVDFNGVAGSGTGDNPKLRACITTDSQTCFTPYQDITLPTSTGIVSTANYPTAYFAGWGKRLPRRFWPKRGYVTITSSVVTVTKAIISPFLGTEPIGQSQLSVNGYFDPNWPAGTKIYINNSTCTNFFCTLAASPTDATHLTIVENIPSLAENEYHSAGLGVIINKKNATNTLTFSARFRLAKSFPQNLGFQGGMSAVPVTSSDSISGFPAIFPTLAGFPPRLGPGGLYFVGTSSPTIRFISPFSNSNCLSSGPDCPNGGLAALGPQSPSFDPLDSSKIYIVQQSNSLKLSIYLVNYTGTWTAYNNVYASNNFNPPSTNELSYTNITSGIGNDIGAQIIANNPGFDVTRFSANNAVPIGLVGPFFLLQNVLNQNATGWIHAFCINNSGVCASAGTGKWYKSWYLLDSTIAGTNIANSGLLRYSGAHAITPTFGSSAANGYSFQLAVNPLNFTNSTLFAGGPFSGTITAVSKSGVFNVNTSLPWPIDFSYDNPCPGGLPAWISTHGATGNQCVTVQGTLPCSATPATGESPCATGLKVGDSLKDSSCGGDCEGFMVVTNPTLVTGSIYQWVMQRDSNPSYCTKQHDGNGSTFQYQHTNGWSYYMNPRDACTASIMIIDIVNDVGYVSNQNLARGHGATLSIAPNKFNRIASGAQLSDLSLVYSIQSNRDWNKIDQPRDGTTPSGPKFAKYPLDDSGFIQSYVDAAQSNASDFNKLYAFDHSHYNGSTGAEPEFPRQTLGGCIQACSGPYITVASSPCVYSVNINGTPDIKKQGINAWVGNTMLIDISSPATGNVISCANPYTQCYAYHVNECINGSSQGQYYVSLPLIDTIGGSTFALCWASQINLVIPCIFAGPTQAMQARHIWISTPDGGGGLQSYLGTLLMGPGQQMVYSRLLPTPDGLYFLFTGFVTSGYHTGPMMAKLPNPILTSVDKTTYIPITINDSGTNFKVRFWYDEYNGFCTYRAESCYAVDSTINESTPFYYASDTFTGQSGSNLKLQIPVLPNHVVYYRVIKNSMEGPTQVAIP